MLGLRKIGAVFFVCLGLAPFALAVDRELIDFNAQVPDEIVNLTDPVSEDYPLVSVNPRSAMVERVNRESSAAIRFGFMNGYGFKLSEVPRHEICIWVHIDGPPVTIPGASPFTTSETQPELFDFELGTEHYTYTGRFTYMVSRGWNEIKIPLINVHPTEWVSADNEVHHRNHMLDYTGELEESITSLLIKVKPNTNVGKIRFNSCRLQRIEKCQVMMIFDDAWKGFNTYALPLLTADRFNATLAVIGSYYQNGGPSEFMSRNQIRNAYNTGLVDVVNHSYSHFPLHSEAEPLPYSTVLDEIQRGMSVLTNAGLTRNNGPRFFIFPGGASDTQTYTALDQVGALYGRALGFENDPNSFTNLIRHPYYGHCYDTAAAENGVNGYKTYESLQQFKDWIDEGVAQGRPRIIMFHDVSMTIGTRTPNQWNSTNWFQAAYSYIRSLKRSGNLEVKSLPGWYSGLDPLHRMRAIDY